MKKYKQDYRLVNEAEELVSQAFMKAEDEEVKDLLSRAMIKLLEFIGQDNMTEVEDEGTYGYWAKADDMDKVIDYLGDFSPRHPFTI